MGKRQARFRHRRMVAYVAREDALQRRRTGHHDGQEHRPLCRMGTYMHRHLPREYRCFLKDTPRAGLYPPRLYPTPLPRVPQRHALVEPHSRQHAVPRLGYRPRRHRGVLRRRGATATERQYHALCTMGQNRADSLLRQRKRQHIGFCEDSHCARGRSLYARQLFQ